MAIPKFEDFLYPFMLHLTDGDSNKADMISVLSDFFDLSEEDKTLKTKGGTSLQLNDRVGWSLQWLRRAHFVEIPERGVWRITKRGRDYMSTASDLRESDLMKYPEFAEYSGHNKNRKKSHEHTTPIIINESINIQAKENWLEIVESIKPFLVDGVNSSLYLNSVLSCLRILGWKKSNGTIKENTGFEQSKDISLLSLCTKNGKSDIPVLCLSPSLGTLDDSKKEYVDKAMSSGHCQICLVFSRTIDVFFANNAKAIPVRVIKADIDEPNTAGCLICSLFDYNSFSLSNIVNCCATTWTQSREDNKIKNRIKELSADTDFIANAFRQVLLSDNYEQNLVEELLAQYNFKIKLTDKSKSELDGSSPKRSGESHDSTTYSFDNGKTFYNKRRFVLEVVRKYVHDNPFVTIDDLENVFPSEIHSKKRGVVRPLSLVQEWIMSTPDLKKRYFLNPSEIIRLHDGTEIVVNNQWGDNFSRFIPVVQKLFGSINEQQASVGENVELDVNKSNEGKSGIKISAASIYKFKNKK